MGMLLERQLVRRNRFSKWKHTHIFIYAAIVLLASACGPTVPTMVPATFTPVPSVPTSTPVQPTSTSSGRDCMGPNAFPTEEATLIWPELHQVQPDRVAPGEKVEVRGTGGHLYWENECGKSWVESAKEFRLYLDEGQVGFIACYASTCITEFVVPDSVSAGIHAVSVEGGSSLNIEVFVDVTPAPTIPATGS